MTSLLLRKSASLSSKRIATVASLINSVHFSSLSASSSSPSSRNEQFARNGGEIDTRSCSIPRFGGVGTRSFHAGSALNVRASNVVSQHAGYAVADFSDEDKSSTSSSSGDGLEISKLGISPEIVTALAKKGITKLFPIQKAVLEPAMKGRDMIGRARTGTGKTLAFGIPIMDKIIRANSKNGRQRNPLALILAPTRELARQVDKEFYESAPNLDTLCVYGGVPISRQMSTLDRGVDVVVGTPGRVIDLLKRGALNLSQVKFVVLDEADQMLAVGFADDVETILEHLPKKRQSMMFSATMPSWIIKLTRKYLDDPLTIDLVGDSDQKLADGITLFSIATETYDKPSIIGPLITEHAKGGKCIVFTQTKRDADRLAKAMNGSLRCEPLHGDISQVQRERTLSGFRDGHFNVLVATDVAARGLDVPNVDLVIHYELPNSSEIFVHRSGRTGRAGKKGNAILIYSSHQYRDVKGLEREVGCNFVELPKIAVEPGARTMLGDYGAGFSSSGRGGSRFGNSSYGGPGRFGPPSGGSSFGRAGGFSGSNSGRSGDGFGRSSPGRSGGFGSDPSGGFGGFGSDFSGSFGNTSGSGRSGNSSSGRTSGFGELASDRSKGFGNKPSSQSSGGRFGGFGENKDW